MAERAIQVLQEARKMSNNSDFRRKVVPTGDAAEVTIRDASSQDLGALRRLAQLDSTRLPPGSIVIAEVGGEVRAAYSLSGRRAIADPFQRTAELVALLRMRAGQLNGHGTRARRRRRRSTAPQPPGFGRGLLPPRVGRR